MGSGDVDEKVNTICVKVPDTELNIGRRLLR